MDYLEAMAAPNFPGEPELTPECRGILGKEAQKAAGFIRYPVAIDMDALKLFISCIVAAHFGANDRHLVAGIPQRT